MCWTLTWLVAGGICGSLAAGGPVNFDEVRPGGLPPGWQSAVTGSGEPRWSVEPDGSAPSPTQVLQQSGWTANPVFPLCLKTNTTLRDGYVEVKFKPVSGTNDQAAGLVWRCRDAQNYYVARANALEHNVVLYKVVDGKRAALDIVGRSGGYGVDVPVPPQEWSRLRVDFQGALFRVALNGKPLFAVRDASLTAAGWVGVWTKADSVTRFDDFQSGASE